MSYVIFGVLTGVLCSVFCAEIPENSCPYFWYMNSEYNSIIGKLILPNDRTGQYVLDITASIRGVYQSLPNLDIRLETSANEIYAGRSIEYSIYFPFWDNIPKITMVTLNRNTYCSGPPFNMEYGSGITTMWAQHVYTLGNMWPSNQYYPSFQHPEEEKVPLENPSETTPSPQTYPQNQASSSPQQNENGFRQPEDNTNSEESQENSVSNDISPYTSKIPISSQGSFELPDSSENSIEKSEPLTYPSRYPPLFTSKIAASHQDSDDHSEPPEDSTEEAVSTETTLPESPLLLSKLVAPAQTSRQKETEDNNFNTSATSFFQHCGAPNEDDTSFRIFNGRPTTEGQYPWLAALLLFDGSSKGSYKCVANLISEKHLLTAAHCVSQFSKESLLLQFYSSDATNQQAVFEYYRSVTDVRISPFYITEPFGDVALLTINQSVISLGATIKPICLWSGGKELDYAGTVAGWGLDEDGLSGVGNPKAIDISMVSSSKCIETYGLQSDYRLFSDYCFCTAHEIAMPCSGDSGAGFMVKNDGRFFLRGIVSVGYRYCGRSSYTIFVDIVPHLNWIMRFLD